MTIEANQISQSTLDQLKTYGFQWYKNQTTDRVDAGLIADIVPAASGFTVIYKSPSVIKFSTARVENIDIPDSPDSPDKTWIRVNWVEIADERF